MAARCSGVYPALDFTFTFTDIAFCLAKASSWESSSALPCLAAQWRQVKPVTKSLLVKRPGSTASRGCRLSHRPSEAHSIHSCSSGSRVTEAQSSSVVEERSDVESPSLFTESRRRDPRLIIDLRTCKRQNVLEAVFTELEKEDLSGVIKFSENAPKKLFKRTHFPVK